MSASLVAWSPALRLSKTVLGAVLCSPQQEMDRQAYLSLLGDRIQRMVDAADDPSEAAEEFESALIEQGLWIAGGRIPTEEVGNRLVWSNPAVHESLEARGLLRNLKGAKVRELKSARTQVEADADSPHSRLLDWAGLLMSRW
jgi:hypothetical protein